MKIKAEEKVNELINKKIYNNPFELRVNGEHICAGMMTVCRIENIREMIRDLDKVRVAIEEEAGITL